MLAENVAGTQLSGATFVPKSAVAGIEFEDPSDGTIQVRLKVNKGTGAPPGSMEEGELYAKYIV